MEGRDRYLLAGAGAAMKLSAVLKVVLFLVVTVLVYKATVFVLR